MDGFQVAIEILGMQRAWRQKIEKDQVFGSLKMRRECPVVAVTAFAQESVQQKSKLAGISHVLTKPVGFNALKKVVNRFYYDKDEITITLTSLRILPPKCLDSNSSIEGKFRLISYKNTFVIFTTASPCIRKIVTSTTKYLYVKQKWLK